MKSPVYNWRGLKTVGGYKNDFIMVSYVGKCIDGWKDFYGDLKPWQYIGYSNPILCKSNNWGYSKMFEKYRFRFCILWHEVCISWH